jgi:hypothetical protein
MKYKRNIYYKLTLTYTSQYACPKQSSKNEKAQFLFPQRKYYNCWKHATGVTGFIHNADV